MIDASALLAILLEEPEARNVRGRIASADGPFTSPLAIYETVARLVRLYGMSPQQADAIVRVDHDEGLPGVDVHALVHEHELRRATTDVGDRPLGRPEVGVEVEVRVAQADLELLDHVAPWTPGKLVPPLGE